MKKQFIYPFEFNEINLTDEMLDHLGFKEWWGGSGYWGSSQINLAGVPIRIFRTHEELDINMGYGESASYQSSHYCGDKFNGNIYFLHELLEYVKSFNSEQCTELFIEKCKLTNLGEYIESYNNYLKTTK